MDFIKENAAKMRRSSASFQETEGMGIIHIAAALIVREKGDTLLVRKRGTNAFLQPGGKIEPGEAAPEALVRELGEELGLVVGL